MQATLHVRVQLLCLVQILVVVTRLRLHLTLYHAEQLSVILSLKLLSSLLLSLAVRFLRALSFLILPRSLILSLLKQGSFLSIEPHFPVLRLDCKRVAQFAFK